MKEVVRSAAVASWVGDVEDPFERAACRRRRGPLPRPETVPGVGPIISTALVAAVGKGEAFDSGRDMAALVGLVPRQYSTGGRTPLGRISKRGSRYLRTLLVQAAKVILMRPQNWSRLSFGAWLTEADQRMHRNKLAVALANKLTRIAWAVLRYGRDFDAPRHVAAKAI